MNVMSPKMNKIRDIVSAAELLTDSNFLRDLCKQCSQWASPMILSVDAAKVLTIGSTLISAALRTE